jgi:hypothetical protein
MAKLMQMEDDRTGLMFESYWIPIQLNFDRISEVGQVMFGGYASKAARMQRRTLVGLKDYPINPQLYKMFFENALLVGGEEALVKACYLMADFVKDRMDGEVPVSFFNLATDDVA